MKSSWLEGAFSLVVEVELDSTFDTNQLIIDAIRTAIPQRMGDLVLLLRGTQRIQR